MTRLLVFIVCVMSLTSVAFAGSRHDKMHEAIQRNDIAAVSDLLKAPGGANQRKDTRASPTFLTQAARLGHAEIVQMLISAGADVNAPDGDNMSPLMHAAQKGHITIVELLLKSGAEVNEFNKWGESPLVLAQQGKHSAIVSLLKRAGAKE